MKKLILSLTSALLCFMGAAQNPYLPLWEHIPDGEPKVFEDPDCPGRYRAYIIGSHDVAYVQYCGPDIHMWSAPVEDLTQWRDEGPIFSYFIDGQWDIMFAPDLVEVKDRSGKKTYWLYPHSRGAGRTPMVCRGDRPDGPFTPVNLTEDGRACVEGSIIDFDPSVYIEQIDDPSDPDYEIGFRAYVYYGFQRSLACELDQNTMYSVRPGTQIIDHFLPASFRYGVVRDPEGTKYEHLWEGQDPGKFNFFEASSIRKVGNKFVMVFSGYSGPDYGLESTNSALRYAFGDSPLGPWRSGGVLVDSRGVVPNEDGSALATSNAAHNTHGSLCEIDGQWYVFYHRPPRGFGFARQAMVAPVRIEWDEAPVSEGGEVRICAYDPYAKDGKWVAKAADGTIYTGAEVTSEGFSIHGLDPYRYYSAGIACYMSDQQWLQDSFDNWDNHMELAGIPGGGIVGFKYFALGDQQKPDASLNIFLTPRTAGEFSIRVLLDGPYTNKVWNGKEVVKLTVPAGSDGEDMRLRVDISSALKRLKGKHALYLVAEGPDGEALLDLHGIGFSRAGEEMIRPVPPTVAIYIDGKLQAIPETPERFTNINGYDKANRYQLRAALRDDSRITVIASSDEVKVKVSEIAAGRAAVTCTYNGQAKIYLIN